MRKSLATLAVVLGTGMGIAAMAQTAGETTGPGAGPADGPMMQGPEGGPFDFGALDANKDGRVTPEEMRARRAEAVAGADADRDGRITESELVAWQVARMTERVTARAKERFAAQDLNGDGTLTVEELLVPPVGEGLFRRADADGDGAVSAAEFGQMQARMADRMDRMRERGGEGGKDGKDGRPWFGRMHGRGAGQSE